MSGARPPGTPRAHSRKQSVYLPAAMLQEMEEQAARLGRSLSQIVQMSWQHGASGVKANAPRVLPS